MEDYLTGPTPPGLLIPRKNLKVQELDRLAGHTIGLLKDEKVWMEDI